MDISHSYKAVFKAIWTSSTGKCNRLLPHVELSLPQKRQEGQTSMREVCSMERNMAREISVVSPWKHPCTQWNLTSKEEPSGVLYWECESKYGSLCMHERTSSKWDRLTSTSWTLSPKYLTLNLVSICEIWWSRSKRTHTCRSLTSRAQLMWGIIAGLSIGLEDWPPLYSFLSTSTWRKIWCSSMTRRPRRCPGKRSVN